MNSVLDDSVIGFLLLLSAGYVIFALGPRGLRQRMLAGLANLTARFPAMFGLRRIAARLEAAAGAKAAGSCGGCNSCGSEQAASPGRTATQPAAPEIRIPVGRIGRRV
jgi:hypothetical protein